MTVTSVKLSDRGKGTLDRLQARLTLLGHPLTKERVLELSLEAASESPGELVGRLKGARYPVPGWEKLLRDVVASAEDWGTTSWRDIDHLVYGGRPKR